VDFNLADLWERVVDEIPDHEALVCGDRRLTYAQADDRATQLAHHLAARGVGAPGDFVQHAERRVVRLARVYDHRQRQFVGNRQLLREERALRRNSLRGVVRVKANFAYRRHARAVRRHKARQGGARLCGDGYLVAVETEGDAPGSAQRIAVQLVVSANGENMRNARLGRACEDGVDVILRAEVGVRVVQLGHVQRSGISSTVVPP
jgi:hypothetical protein